MIPAEAVEATAIAWVGAREWLAHSDEWRSDRLEDVGQILEAAAPHMLAGAFEGGFQKGVEFQEWAGHLDDHKPDFNNPYRIAK